jgi:hypothetical protein
MDVVHNIVHFTVYKLNYPNIVFTKYKDPFCTFGWIQY